MATSNGYHVLILAGSRQGGEPFVVAENKSLKAALDIAGKPMLSHVLETVSSWPWCRSVTISLPEGAPIAEEAPGLNDLIEKTGATLIPTSSSPCKSIQLALQHFRTPLANSEPVLIVTGDAPLLSHGILNELRRQNSPDTDFIAGIAKVDLVEQAYPQVRRTRIKLRDGAVGGCNLFILNSPAAEKVIRFWQKLENNRKKPWRMAASFWMMVKYILGVLSLNGARKGLERQIGCKVGFAFLTDPHAAIDVDKSKDLTLVRSIMAKQKK